MVDSKTIYEAVDEAVISSLASMGFINANAEEANWTEIKEAMAYKIKVLMPFLDEIVVIMPRSLALEIVGNIFGDAFNPDNTSLVADGLAEYLNVMAGAVFQKATPKMLFELGIPQAVTLDKINLAGHEMQTYVTTNNQVMCVAHKLKNFKPKN